MEVLGQGQAFGALCTPVKVASGPSSVKNSWVFRQMGVALGASAELIEVNPNPEVPGEHLAMLRLPSESDIATWVRWISEQVELTSCTPWRPGMRDIFIRAVEHQKQPVA